MTANRGKYAEGKVRDFLKEWAETHANFCFNRILDARSAMGAMSNPTAGDYQWFMRTEAMVTIAELTPGSQRIMESEASYTRNGLIEVKSVEHATRLPYKNFAIDQVGRMRVRQLAGSEPLVLVCHRVGGKTFWRAPAFEFFEQRDPTRPSGSWDLTDIEPVSKVDQILQAYLK